MDELLKQYEDLKWEFTYGHPTGPDECNVLQVGLVAIFYIENGYLVENRLSVIKSLELFNEYYGMYLKFGFMDNPNYPEKYSDKSIEERKKQIIEKDDDDVDFCWGSSSSLEYVNDYEFKFFSPAGWFEEIHRSISFVSVYLPINELLGDNKFKTESVVERLCTILKPAHGFFGLGLQQCYEYHEYQHLEYEIAHDFRGVDISNSNNSELFRDGFKSVNWFTILSDKWVNKLGGAEHLRQNAKDERIKFIPYPGGLIVKAGECPALGYVQTDPCPELYVKVNRLLRAARAPKIGSLGFGSIHGEVRFNNRTTAEWLARFDRCDEKAESTIVSFEGDRRRIVVASGDLCRFSGLWSSFVNGELVYQELQQGFAAPPYWDDKTNNEYEVLWTLLRRDDGGDVYE